jgi:hypothetical protein
VYGVQEAAIREVAQERNSRRKKKNSSWSSRARDTPFQTTAILSSIFDECVFFGWFYSKESRTGPTICR